ncbi:MAG: hypothetical protein EOM53_03870 [Alphaproteobacteria bacterium]|nr:hypothetical protein [Alphaproteobacteria bacterium]NCB49797.1 hypothetical protein [Alphaproteobacteria bacterium]
MKKWIFIALGCLGLSACGTGQTIFYWQQEGIGPLKFSRDHEFCLGKANYFSWTWPAWPPGTEPLLELRFDNDASNGIWANFVPYLGAQEVYVNSKVDDSNMSPSVYERCMVQKGYKHRRPNIISRHVMPK